MFSLIGINAFVYMTLSRIIYFYIPSKSCLGIPATRLAKLFVWLDVVSFIIQLAGGVLIQPGQEPRVLNIGIKIYESGVGVQELFVLVFCGVAGRFHWHMLKMEREEKEKAKPRWRMMLYTCYVVLALITVSFLSLLSGKHPLNALYADPDYLPPCGTQRRCEHRRL
jgi:hypothetical protein